MVRGWCRAEAAARTGCSRSPSHSSSLLRRNVAFAARALRVASLPFAVRAAIISPHLTKRAPVKVAGIPPIQESTSARDCAPEPINSCVDATS